MAPVQGMDMANVMAQPSGLPAAPSFSAPRQAQALVSAGVAAHKTGDAALAEQLLLQALEIEPRQADALQLLGLLARRRGDLPAAENLMRQSLAIDARQPHVHHNLGNLLKSRGATETALGHYDQALALAPDYVEALIQQGETLILLGREAAAEAPLRKACRLAPQSVAARAALADWCGKNGATPEAEQLLRQGLQRDPDNVYYNNNLGSLLVGQERYAEALPFLQGLIKTAPDRPEVFFNIGNCLMGLGQLPEAVNHYLKTISLEPLHYFAHANLNKLLWEMGRAADVGKSFIFAKQALPDHPGVLEMSAENLIAFTRLDEAEADLAAAARLRPESTAQFRLWSALRLAQARPEDAIGVASAGLQADPSDLDLWRKLGEACLMADRPRQALAAARQLAAREPFNQFAAAYLATAHRLLGEPDLARQWYDYDRFIGSADLPPPPGYADLASYHADLAGALDRLHHSQQEPVQQTLRNGTQTHENLFTRPGIDASIAALGRQILAQALLFIAGLPHQPDHPFLGRRATALAWSGSWSVRLRESGFHTDHIHPKGWISGVYYVETPPCLADEQAKPGWISFGAFRQAAGPTLPYERVVRPRPGLMLLFPSYMWHGTLPITGIAPRLTVAFDLIPG